MPIILGLVSTSQDLRGEFLGPDAPKALRDAILMSILPKLKRQDHKCTLSHTQVMIHYKCSNSMYYFCAAKDNFPQRVCWAFLDALEEEMNSMRSAEKSKVNSIIKEKMKYYNDPSSDKVRNLKNKVDEVKDIMTQNIEKLLDRGDKIEHILSKTDDILESAQDFRRGTRTLKNNMLSRYILLIFILIMIIICVIIVVILILIFSICGMTFSNCQSKTK